MPKIQQRPEIHLTVSAASQGTPRVGVVIFAHVLAACELVLDPEPQAKAHLPRLGAVCTNCAQIHDQLVEARPGPSIRAASVRREPFSVVSRVLCISRVPIGSLAGPWAPGQRPRSAGLRSGNPQPVHLRCLDGRWGLRRPLGALRFGIGRNIRNRVSTSTNYFSYRFNHEVAV